MTKNKSVLPRCLHVLASRSVVARATVVLALCFVSVCARADPGIDKNARLILRLMSTFLAAQRQFSVQAIVDDEVVLKNGQKLRFSSEATLNVRRPDRIHLVQNSYRGQLEAFFNGTTISLLGGNGSIYYRIPSRGTLDNAFDTFKGGINAAASGTDLLYSDVFDRLIAGVQSGTMINREPVDGVPCDHLAFRSNSVDWQIWITTGPAPLPRKYIITARKMNAAPAYSVRFHDWNLAPRFAAGEFTFRPPSTITYATTQMRVGRQLARTSPSAPMQASADR